MNTCGDFEEVTFTLTDDCGNFITLTATFTIEGTLGANELIKENIVLYPNPSLDYVIIKGLRQEAKVFVYSLSGQLIMTSKVNNSVPLYFDLASGLYLLKIEANTGTVMKKLIVE